MIRAEHTIESPELTVALGATLGRVLTTGDVLELHGDLGAGKTTLVRGIARGMGLDPQAVSSPTFVILHRYTSDQSDTGPGVLVHMDAYRLDADTPLDELGWDRAIADAAACVEWPERLGSLLHEDMRARLGEAWRDRLGVVRLAHAGGDTRTVAIELPEAWDDRAGVEALRTNPPRACPKTGEPVSPDAPHYPFSSERAQMADLHNWFSEGYSLTRPMDPDDWDELQDA